MIRIGREIQCLPYAGFFLPYFFILLDVFTNIYLGLRTSKDGDKAEPIPKIRGGGSDPLWKNSITNPFFEPFPKRLENKNPAYRRH